MSAQGGNAAPVIIKRKKVTGGDGHHGGAWKVAIAFSFRLWRFCACSKLPPQTEVGLNSRSDICSCWGLGRLPRHPIRMQAQHGLSDANGTLNRASDLPGI